MSKTSWDDKLWLEENERKISGIQDKELKEEARHVLSTYEKAAKRHKKLKKSIARKTEGSSNWNKEKAMIDECEMHQANRKERMKGIFRKNKERINRM